MHKYNHKRFMYVVSHVDELTYVYMPIINVLVIVCRFAYTFIFLISKKFALISVVKKPFKDRANVNRDVSDRHVYIGV